VGSLVVYEELDIRHFGGLSLFPTTCLCEKGVKRGQRDVIVLGERGALDGDPAPSYAKGVLVAPGDSISPLSHISMNSSIGLEVNNYRCLGCKV